MEASDCPDQCEHDMHNMLHETYNDNTLLCITFEWKKKHENYHEWIKNERPPEQVYLITC